jgi:hypothetical protein
MTILEPEEEDVRQQTHGFQQFHRKPLLRSARTPDG